MSFLKMRRSLVMMGIVGLVTAASANADIMYDLTGSQFGGGGIVLNSTGGTGSATLTYTNPGGNDVLVPTNISFGSFALVCACGGGTNATFSAFTFNIIVNDNTDTAVGQFVGSSSGGTVTAGSSNIVINWSPTILGPDGTNATSGDFGTTTFQISSPTLIVPPNNNSGVTTVQGFVNFDQSPPPPDVPEPATLGLIGSGLMGIGLISFRKRSKQA
jgi:PEP-CTERM motif